MSDSVSKSWFCVLNNPSEHGYDGNPEEIAERIKSEWIEENPQRSCAVAYCISADALHHLHAVFEDTKAMRFSAIKKLFSSMHIEATKGSKDEAEDYINKRGKWVEKDEQVLYIARHGEIQGRQSSQFKGLSFKEDYDMIETMIADGLTPNQIMDACFRFRRHSKIIKEAYYRKRNRETPLYRDITVYWHVGASGTGKSYTSVKLAEIHGEEQIYIATDFKFGFLDHYNGEPILFMDEYKGQMVYDQLLKVLDKLKVQIHSRYTNAFALWREAHITSVFPPDLLYQKMKEDARDKSIDSYEQLRRRISFIVYHYKKNDEYLSHTIPMSEYINYNVLRNSVENPDHSKSEKEILAAFGVKGVKTEPEQEAPESKSIPQCKMPIEEFKKFIGADTRALNTDERRGV